MRTTLKKQPLLAMSICVLMALLEAGCGEDSKSSNTGGASKLVQQKAQQAVAAVEANLDSLQDAGGYQTWTPEKAADKLVTLMNAAQAPEPGEPKATDIQFSYVKDIATGPWQVAISIDDAKHAIIATAYGSNTLTPLATKTITVSQY